MPIRLYEMRTVLSIAGSDCSGGAGIQADLKTCAALGVYCCTAITAVTVQNPSGVKAVNYVGDNTLRSQFDAVLESIRPDAVKIGMLPCKSAVETVADMIIRSKLKNIILDPVLSATSGASLSGNDNHERTDTISALKTMLFPLCTLVTPNMPELNILGEELMHLTTYRHSMLLESWHCENILIKGGHNQSDHCTDILVTHDGETAYTAPRIYTTHTHGTGCTLSSAIASYLAKGENLKNAVKAAKEFTTMCIKRASGTSLFPDNGPLIHFLPDSSRFSI